MKKEILILYTFIFLSLNLSGQQLTAESPLSDLLAALEKARKETDNSEVFRLCNILGYQYWRIGELDQASGYFGIALNVAESRGNQQAIASLNNHLGLIKTELDQPDSALIYLQAALKVYQLMNRKESIASEFLNIALALQQSENYDEAVLYLEKGLLVAKELNDLRLIQKYYGIIAETYQLMGKNEEAMAYYDQFRMLEKKFQEEFLEIKKKEAQNAVQSAETEKDLAIQAKIEKEIALENTSTALNEAIKISREKALQLDLLEKESRIRDLELLEKKAQLHSASLLRNSLIGGGFMMMVLAGVMFVAYWNKKTSNLLLAKRNSEISTQRDQIQAQSIELAHAFTEIKDQHLKISRSLNYAQRIQEAMLSRWDKIHKYIPHNMVFFRPRDIVSGDFYWFKKAGPDNLLIVAAADCTGHGVPGAFMSMIGNDLLEQSVQHISAR